MRKPLGLLALLLVPSALHAHPQTPQTLHPVADAKVYEASPTTNMGRETTLAGRSGPGGRYRSYLRFDLGSSSAPILTAACASTAPTPAPRADSSTRSPTAAGPRRASPGRTSRTSPGCA